MTSFNVCIPYSMRPSAAGVCMRYAFVYFVLRFLEQVFEKNWEKMSRWTKGDKCEEQKSSKASPKLEHYAKHNWYIIIFLNSSAKNTNVASLLRTLRYFSCFQFYAQNATNFRSFIWDFFSSIWFQWKKLKLTWKRTHSFDDSQ